MQLLVLVLLLVQVHLGWADLSFQRCRLPRRLLNLGRREQGGWDRRHREGRGEGEEEEEAEQQEAAV